jgi:hypothetical protein
MPDLSVISRIQDIAFTGTGDGVTVTAGPGVCYLPDGTRMRSAGATASLPSTPANGWWYAYGYPTTGGMMGLELSQTGPDTPYQGTARTKLGDTTRRYLSQGLVASNKLRPAIHLQAGSKGNFVLFDQSTATFTTQPILLNLLTPTFNAPLTTSLAGVVPANATAVRLQINNQTNGFLYLQRGSLAPASAAKRQVGVQPNNSIVLDVRLDSTLSISTIITNTNLLGVIVSIIYLGGYSIEVQGYFFDR